MMPRHDQHAVLRRRRLLHAGAMSFVTMAFSGPLRAAPDAILHLLCSGPAGSIPDLVARALAEQLPAVLGRQALVENRPGAAGQLSVNALKAATPDGSTLLVAQGAIATVYPYLYPRLAYDADVDLRPVTLAGEMNLALAIGPAVPSEVRTLKGFVNWLRSHPAGANIGSPGTGTLPHLVEALLMREAGVSWQHIAYSGGPPAVNDLLSGQIAGLVLPEGLLAQHHATGRLRVIASTAAARSAYLPDVPSFAEQGHPALVLKEWFAVFAPAATPDAAIARMSEALQVALVRPDLAALFAKADMTPVSCSPAALAARITAEQRHWKTVIQALGITAE